MLNYEYVHHFDLSYLILVLSSIDLILLNAFVCRMFQKKEEWMWNDPPQSFSIVTENL